MDLKPFLTLTEWAVAEPRKAKACVLTVTQFLFNVGQIARFFFLLHLQIPILAVYFETTHTLLVEKTIKNLLRNKFPMIATVLRHKVLKYFQHVI